MIALAFIGWDRWIKPKTLAVLVAVPLIFVPLVLINPSDVMIADPVIIETQGIRDFEHSFPPLFVLLLAWGLGVASLSAGLIGYAGAKRTVPWQPALIGVLVFLLPVVIIALKTGRIYPPDGNGIAVTPAVNAIALGILAVAITKYRIFELLPIGRDHAVEVMEDGYVLVSSDETILDANPAARQLLLGESGSSLTQKSICDVISVYDDLSGFDGSDRAIFTRDDRTVEVRRSPLTRQQQNAGCLLILEDITEKKTRERKLKRTNERLNQFASVVTHDLRNPLSVAKGRLDLEREDNASEHLDAIDTALDRMDVLIDDMLTLARQGQPISDFETVTLSLAATRCWDVIERHDATLTVDDDLTFRADSDRLKQLLENLFRNAIEHGRSGVTIHVGSLDEWSGFYIADDASGIPEADRDEIFESGYSTAENGTGLGLAIVKEIVDAHGWEIRLTDSAEGGARFEITGVEPVD